MKDSFYIFETQYEPEEYIHQCDVCKKGMNEGYLHENTGGTFCTSDCLFDGLGLGIASELLESQIVFWTTWYDEMEATL